EEHGDAAGVARAELLRLDCAFERLPEGDPERTSLHRRITELVVEHGRAWQGAWGAGPGFDRGLLFVQAPVARARKVAERDPFAGATVQSIVDLLSIPALAPLRGIVARAIRRGIASRTGSTPSESLDLLLQHAERQAAGGLFSDEEPSYRDAPDLPPVRRLL